MAESQLTVALQRLELATMQLTLVGDSPLICHAWSSKAKKSMLDKQMKKARQAKEAKSPEDDFEQSLYRLPDGTCGFPAVAFKSAAVGACRFADGMKMTSARGAFHVVGELVPIEGEPTPREDMVRVGMGIADIRYRGQFEQWRATITIQFNTRAISAEQIVALFDLGGFGVGVGEWRPERNGSYGRFHVEVKEANAGEQDDGTDDGVSVAAETRAAGRSASGRRGTGEAPRGRQRS